jgi:hypothetical protein
MWKMQRFFSRLLWKLTKPEPLEQIINLQKQKRIAREAHRASKEIDKKIKAITTMQLRKSVSKIGENYGS